MSGTQLARPQMQFVFCCVWFLRCHKYFFLINISWTKRKKYKLGCKAEVRIDRTIRAGSVHPVCLRGIQTPELTDIQK
jgi:hypothetical protein